MQQDLLKGLVQKPQREVAGSRAATAFDYQKDWAFCQMLRRHLAGANYLVAFEFHDDAVFFDDADAPRTVEFHQVKTQEDAKPKSLTSLLARKHKKRSVLGKLASSIFGICESYDVKVILVSNVAFDFSGSNIKASDLGVTLRKKIVTALKTECPGFDAEHLERVHFAITGVSLDAMESFLHGEAATLFKKQFGEHHGYNVHSWVRLLKSEITRRNNYPSDEISTVGDLIAKKCVGRTMVDETLAAVQRKHREAPEVELILREAEKWGWSLDDRMSLRRILPQVSSDYVDPGNIEVAKLGAVIAAELQSLRASGSVDLHKLLRFAQGLRGSAGGTGWPYDRIYLTGLAITVYYEKF